MPVSNDYIDFIRDLLAAFEPLRIKHMFGGAGVYSEDFFFAILADDALYLKVDEYNRSEYERLGLGPFTYETKSGRTSSMSYYPVPPEMLEDPEALEPWVRGALEAARRAFRSRKPSSIRAKVKRSAK